MNGGEGRDIYIFRSAAEIGRSAGNRDIIEAKDTQFKIDRIDLRRIDADITSGGHQKFVFIGKNEFSNNAGELRYTVLTTGGTLIEGDLDGGGRADFVIEISDEVPLITVGNFIGVINGTRGVDGLANAVSQRTQDVYDTLDSNTTSDPVYNVNEIDDLLQ